MSSKVLILCYLGRVLKIKLCLLEVLEELQKNEVLRK